MRKPAPIRHRSHIPISPSAVSEARIDRRMMCGQAAPARFRYSDLKEAARGCGGRGPYGGLNGMDGRCAGVSGYCCGARKTTADALEFGEAPDGRGIKTGEVATTRFVEAQGTERLRAPRHAKISCCGSSTHVATVTGTGGERSWIWAEVNRSMAAIGPPHWGQNQRSLAAAVEASCLACGVEPSN